MSAKHFGIPLALALFVATPAAACDYDGVVAHMVAKPGQREALIEALRPLVAMEGLIDLVVAHDPENPDAIWLTEVWANARLHKEAATGEVFTKAMVRIKPVLASIDRNYTTVPVFGNRLK